MAKKLNKINKYIKNCPLDSPVHPSWRRAIDPQCCRKSAVTMISVSNRRAHQYSMRKMGIFFGGVAKFGVVPEEQQSCQRGFVSPSDHKEADLSLR